MSVHFAAAGPHLPTRACPLRSSRRRNLTGFRCTAGDEDYYLIDAPESIGDGFSFSGGKYSSEGPSRSDEWLARGKMVRAHPVSSVKGTKAKEPIFGLAMATTSQSSDDVFKWFCVTDGEPSKHRVLLLHGFPSQAYSFRNVLPKLSSTCHATAFDWLGFGFSDKPQPGYGFEYTLNEYVSALESLIDAISPSELSLVVQGYFAPIAVKYANENQEKVRNLILVNPPILDAHAKLPSSLSMFGNFLLGEIFAQDPIRASDKALTSCGPYAMDEEDAMVYRRPYLTSGSSGFALNAITRAMNKDLKDYVASTRSILASNTWRVGTTVVWGMRDRWLGFNGISDFCQSAKLKLVELPMAGHHVQEDRGDELGGIIAAIIR